MIKQIWQCACGHANTSHLKHEDDELTCSLCGRKFRFRREVLQVRESEEDTDDGLGAVASAALSSLLDSGSSSYDSGSDTSSSDTSSSWDGGGGDFSGGGSSGDF